RPGYLEPRPGLQVRPTWVGRHLHVGVLRTPARLAGFECGADRLSLRIGLDLAEGGAPVPAAAELVLARRGGRATQSFPVTVTGDGPGRAQLRGDVPLAALPARADRAADPVVVAGPEAADDAAYWDLYVRPAGQRRIPVTFPEGVAEARVRRDGREAAVG